MNHDDHTFDPPDSLTLWLYRQTVDTQIWCDLIDRLNGEFEEEHEGYQEYCQSYIALWHEIIVEGSFELELL